MAKYALYVALKAKPGKAAEVEAFLKQGAEMAKAESGTVTWYGTKKTMVPTRCSIPSMTNRAATLTSAVTLPRH
jgi:quinol monooxygenase YgiN